MCTTTSKERNTSPEKCIAKNKPVKIWTPKNTPSKEPKFQKYLKDLGEGKSINTPLIILTNWSFLRNEVKIISLFNLSN